MQMLLHILRKSSEPDWSNWTNYYWVSKTFTSSLESDISKPLCKWLNLARHTCCHARLRDSTALTLIHCHSTVSSQRRQLCQIRAAHLHTIKTAHCPTQKRKSS